MDFAEIVNRNQVVRLLRLIFCSLLKSFRYPCKRTFSLFRIYDRNPETPPADPYYAGGVPQGPPAHMDPYQNYDPYQKFYPNRPRESEFPASASQNPSSRFVLYCSLSRSVN